MTTTAEWAEFRKAADALLERHGQKRQSWKHAISAEANMKKHEKAKSKSTKRSKCN